MWVDNQALKHNNFETQLYDKTYDNYSVYQKVNDKKDIDWAKTYLTIEVLSMTHGNVNISII